MKKCAVTFALLYLFTIGYCPAQSSQDYSQQATSCDNELSTLQGKRAAIDADYDKVVNELRQGLFCSLCNRSKSQIEKDGVNFYQHIKDVKGNVVAAPAKAYEQAHQEYLSKFNSWQREVENKQKSCNNLRSLSKSAADNEQKQIVQANQQKQQQVQEQYRQQQELNRQMQAKAQEKIAEAAQAQQLQLDALRVQQQQEFGKSVSDYVSTESDNLKKRQQAADDIAQHGSLLAQSIQGNKIDLSKISPENIGTASVFSSASIYDDVLKSNSAKSNNYFEQYSSLVQDLGQKAIVAESQLSETFKNGFESAKKYITFFKASNDLADGKITENTVSAYFSATPNALIKTIQKHTGGLAVKQANSISDLGGRIGNEDFSERDFERTVAEMNPLHFSPTFVKEQKPFNFKDAAVIVGGGIVLSTVGAPIWLGIGAAAWYGFNR